MKILLDHGATLNTRASETGFTPLHLAAAAGDAAVIKMLLAKGADRTTRDVFGATPLEHAVHLNQTASVEALLPPGGASQLADLLSEAVVKGNAGMVSVLLDRGADVNARNKSASTPLHDAALKNRVEVAKVLLQHGAGRSCPQRLWRLAPPRCSVGWRRRRRERAPGEQSRNRR